ncbi:pentapeptide repeat-containing protein [Streptomyces sp. NPDC057620]|uniref:pentapeptide repeat-containing protein n=1 Tax=Streptomyces sp. NPDC057620 TaxID=3346185 RepID=UPI0036CADA96
MDEDDRAAHLAALSPGANIDHRGTTFTEPLLGALLGALHDPLTGLPCLGVADFQGAAFQGDAQFSEVTFSGLASFYEATFSGDALFRKAIFSSGAAFTNVTFSGDARFFAVAFSSTSTVGFVGATFSGDARFDWVAFSGNAWFRGATFTGDASFYEARFEKASHLGPLVCGKQVVLDGAVFRQPMTVEISARQVSCKRTSWAATATLYLRYADLDLRDAVFEYPVVVAARADPFLHPIGTPVAETVLSGEKPGVRLVSVVGADAAHLALQDIDLSTCRFAGAVHLDQLKVDGWCTFATAPADWDWRFPWRWSWRNTLVEEHHWRVRTARHPHRTIARGWTAPPDGALKLPPAALAALYRQMRKSLEDGKNEPDAADFYYGECEMRRHDLTRPRGERALLAAYWTLSGYGLRATRALAWLGAAMAATIAVMVLWGLPVDGPKPTITGRQSGADISLTADTPDPVNPTGPWTERVTTERGEKALRVVINSVIFRSSGQDLTTAGTYTEMVSRLAEPVLLGLAVLAVRSRVKR